MPCVASLDAFHQAIAEFTVTDPGLVIEPAALAAALMQALELTSLALEWPEDFTPMIRAFLAGGTLADLWWLWVGDGRITAGHLAVLAERAAAGGAGADLVRRGRRRGLELVPA